VPSRLISRGCAVSFFGYINRKLGEGKGQRMTSLLACAYPASVYWIVIRWSWIVWQQGSYMCYKVILPPVHPEDDKVRWSASYSNVENKQLSLPPSWLDWHITANPEKDHGFSPQGPVFLINYVHVFMRLQMQLVGSSLAGSKKCWKFKILQRLLCTKSIWSEKN